MTININEYTVFEDLSNEIIYEISEYLDNYEVYLALSKLNKRFRNLFTVSNLPIKVNTSNISKSSFQEYYQQFIIHNTHRISSLYLLNSLIFKLMFPSRENIIIFTRLESLFLDNIHSIDLADLLDDLATLPNLSLLVINSLTNYRDKTRVYLNLFRLPALKSCRLSLGDSKTLEGLPIAVENFSSIEHLVINDAIYLDDFVPLLSYVPHLRYLSIKCLFRCYDRPLIKVPLLVLNNLRYVSIKLKHTTFDRFEPYIRNLFHYLQVLRISISNDDEYLNAKRWERVILSHMSYLRIFDIQYKKCLIRNGTNIVACQALMTSFATSFWTERKWFFTHQHNHLGRLNCEIFYSIQPYRRKYYTLNGSRNQCGFPCHIGSSLDSVRHIHIEDESDINNCSIDFPNATELTISNGVDVFDELTISTIVGIMPLSKLTKIAIDNDRIYLTDVIKMLCLTPNCNKLMLNSVVLDKRNILSLQCSENFQFLSDRNNITDITVKSSCTFEQVQLLINLCPRLQHLTINVLQEEFQSIVKYLLMNNEHTRYLRSLYIQNKGDIWTEKLLNAISEVRQQDEVSVEAVGYYFHMEQMKRLRNGSSNNDDNYNRKNIQIRTPTMDGLSRGTITCFEQLSNELIYDIFEFLDFHHVYQAFFNLNLRFRNLLTDSTLPIQVNLSSISKLAFEKYNKDIIVLDKLRIHSFHLSNLFIYEHVSSPTHILSEYVRLESLFLHNIESNYLENLLHELKSLPYLTSLSIISIDKFQDKNSIYRQIFILPALKYCNLSLKEWYGRGLLPVATNEYSPIEHLVINNSEPLHELAGLLSYVPRLRRLSLHSVYNSSRMTPAKIHSSSRVLNHLTDVYLDLSDIEFDQFEQLIRNIFPVTVQVLSISISNYSEQKYLHANRWEQLILSHMPNLRIFDIRHDFYTPDGSDRLTYEDQINQFTSRFWIERRWFFEHLHYWSKYGNRAIFYSINPYRRKDYTIYKQVKEITCLPSYETNFKSVHHVCIPSEEDVIICQSYFPNTTELTLENGFSTTRDSIASIINPIIPLKQLTKLVIECHHFSFIRVIELLRNSPNIQTLILESMPLYKKDRMSIQQSETFRLLSNTNTITDVTLKDKCTLDRIEMIVALCPRLQHFTLDTHMKDMESLIRLLLEKSQQNTCHMFSLCFSRATKHWYQKLEALIKSETLLDDYMLKLVGSELYLWW